MTEDPIFSKNAPIFKAVILLYQSSLERKNLVKLKETQPFYSVIKLTKPSLYQRLYEIKKTERGIRYHLFLN